MNTRTLIATVVVVILGAAVLESSHLPGPNAPALAAAAAAAEKPANHPWVNGADPELSATIEAAIARFDEIGLPLPALRIYYHPSDEGCGGHSGLFNGDGSGGRIDLCTRVKNTILHELAHAWEHHGMSDPARQAFLERNGLESWNHVDTDWDERGIEAVAQAIAWGLMDTPITNPAAFPQQLEEFELLTGLRSPRLATD